MDKFDNYYDILDILEQPPSEDTVNQLISLISNTSTVFYNSKDIPVNTINYLYILHPYINKYFYYLRPKNKAEFIHNVLNNLLPLLLKNKLLKYMYRAFHYQFYLYPHTERKRLFNEEIAFGNKDNLENLTLEELSFNIMLRDQLLKISHKSDYSLKKDIFLADLLSHNFLERIGLA